jgi:CheY-like chemotaxis protein
LDDQALQDQAGPQCIDLGVGAIQRNNQAKAIPIIAVTAFATPGDETKALESGCAAYITKPVNVDELVRTIELFLLTMPPTIGSSR